MDYHENLDIAAKVKAKKENGPAVQKEMEVTLITKAYVDFCKHYELDRSPEVDDLLQAGELLQLRVSDITDGAHSVSAELLLVDLVADTGLKYQLWFATPEANESSSGQHLMCKKVGWSCILLINSTDQSRIDPINWCAVLA